MVSIWSGWPTASWNSTPPIPGASTTGISPAGAGIESSIATARRAAIRAGPPGGGASMNLDAGRPAPRPLAGRGALGGRALGDVHQRRSKLAEVGDVTRPPVERGRGRGG